MGLGRAPELTSYHPCSNLRLNIFRVSGLGVRAVCVYMYAHICLCVSGAFGEVKVCGFWLLFLRFRVGVREVQEPPMVSSEAGSWDRWATGFCAQGRGQKTLRSCLTKNLNLMRSVVREFTANQPILAIMMGLFKSSSCR